MKIRLAYFFMREYLYRLVRKFVQGDASKKARGIMALAEANNAADREDFNKAIDYARQVLVIGKNSPSAELAAMQIRELGKKISEKMTVCKY